MDDERLAQLEQWMRQDHSIKILVRDMLRTYGEDTLSALAEHRPDDFTQVHDAIATMVEDIGVEDVERGRW